MSRAILSLAAILAFRMLGLFMIYPVFVVYAPRFSYATPTLIGIALGIYGLTQAIFQLPLSMMSDYLGRKPVVTGGLIVFLLGSILCGLTHNIYLLLLGRALQGAGAIGSTLMACAADISSDKNRTKAMAILGMTIGASFTLALLIGPMVNAWLRLSGIFWLTALFALIGIVITHFFIPATTPKADHSASYIDSLWQLLKQQDLLKFNIHIFILHALFTASFVALPLLFVEQGITSSTQWHYYLPTLLGAALCTLPLLNMFERRNLIKQAQLFSILSIGLGEYAFYQHSLSFTAFGLFAFFLGFTFLEALLPALISKSAPPRQKGSAMGIFSTFQFLGIFVGGALAGTLRNYYAHSAIFYGCLLLCAVWAALTRYLLQATHTPKNQASHAQ